VGGGALRTCEEKKSGIIIKIKMKENKKHCNSCIMNDDVTLLNQELDGFV